MATRTGIAINTFNPTDRGIEFRVQQYLFKSTEVQPVAVATLDLTQFYVGERTSPAPPDRDHGRQDGSIQEKISSRM